MKIRFTFLILIILIISGCNAKVASESNDDEIKSNDLTFQDEKTINDLNQKLSEEEAKVKQQQDEINQKNETIMLLQKEISTNEAARNYTLFYKDLNFCQCLLTSDVELRHEPITFCISSRPVSKNTLVQVLASVDVFDGIDYKSWLLVNTVTYDEPSNSIGWIEEADTTLLTDENRYSVISPVKLKKGCIDLQNKYKDLDTDMHYYIISIEGDIAYIGAIGGWNTYIDKNYIEFPTP